MKLNIKYIVLPLSIMACINGNYSNSMEVEEEINTNQNPIILNDNIVTNNINQSNTNNNQVANDIDENHEIYKHLFEENYNKDKYEQLCTECIENINRKRPEYIHLMQDTAKVFDNLIKSIHDLDDLNEIESSNISPDLPEIQNDISEVIKINKKFNIFENLQDHQDILFSDPVYNSDELRDEIKQQISTTELY